MTPTLANLRKGDGCRDTNVNGDDFVLTNGTPRNTSSPFATCTQSTAVPAPPPVAFALRGATPNPAARELALGFSLANSAPARLTLLDVAGRIVATREVGAMGPGAHVVRFTDLARLAPGVYLARLSQRGASVTTRIVIAR